MESLGPYQILLVDSDLSNAQFAERVLPTWGLKVFTAKNSEEAIELTKVNSFDLILMDVQMTDIDGFETARIIRRLGDQFQDVPIIGHGNVPIQSNVNLLEDQGLNDFILKPFPENELYNKLKKHLEKGQPNVVIANLDRCTEGDVEFRRELAQLLANNISELLLSIDKALKLKDPNIFGRAVHKTKTTLSILGDVELTEELSIIQKKISPDSPALDLDLHVQKLHNRCAKTINILNSLSAQ